jgi:hypothetical protein
MYEVESCGLRRYQIAIRQLGDDQCAGVLISSGCFSSPRDIMLIPSFSPFVQRDHARILQLSNRLVQSINAQVEHVVRNGDVNGYPGCVNLSFSYVEGESLLMALKVRY